MMSGTFRSIGIFVLLLFSVSFTRRGPSAFAKDLNYREEMRSFVRMISRRGKRIRPGFIVIPQNGVELLTVDGKPEGQRADSYLDSIDGIGCEDIFFGEGGSGKPTSTQTTGYLLDYLLLYKKLGKTVLTIDYVKNRKQAGESRRRSSAKGFLSFQGELTLSSVPVPAGKMNRRYINRLGDVKNFLYLINGSRYRSRKEFLKKLGETSYDLLVLDAFFQGKALDGREISELKRKATGEKRLVLAYLSIGEAEDYRYYWKREWKKYPPPFLRRENPRWKGNYKVTYWMDDWKEIICGRHDGRGFERSYLKRILDAGFDGVYLDIIDAAFYFENREK